MCSARGCQSQVTPQPVGTTIPMPLQAKCPCLVCPQLSRCPPLQSAQGQYPPEGVRTLDLESRHPPPLGWLADGHNLVLIESLHCKPVQSLVSTVRRRHKTVREAHSYTQRPLVPSLRHPRLTQPLGQFWSLWKDKPLLQTCYTEKPSGKAPQASAICMAQHSARASTDWRPGHLSLGCY